jgi:diacylglycerol kinase (ATP)
MTDFDESAENLDVVSPVETALDTSGNSGRMQRPLRLRIIHNKRAGAQNQARFRAVLALLERNGHTYHILVTQKAGDAADFVRSADAEAVDMVVVSGGDGTINDALQGIGPNTPPLGLMPLGTANVLAHEIGLGTDPEKIAACLMDRHIMLVRPGVVNGRRFMMMASVGLDAQVVADLPRMLKQRLGKLAYLVQAARTLRHFACPPMDISIDGTPMRAAVLIANRGQRYGGRFILAPDAHLADPRFHISVFPVVGRLAILARLVAIPLGLVHRLRLIRQVTGFQIEIAGPQGNPVQADGDVVARLPAVISLDSQVIQLCVPFDCRRHAQTG